MANKNSKWIWIVGVIILLIWVYMNNQPIRKGFKKQAATPLSIKDLTNIDGSNIGTKGATNYQDWIIEIRTIAGGSKGTLFADLTYQDGGVGRAYDVKLSIWVEETMTSGIDFTAGEYLTLYYDSTSTKVYFPSIHLNPTFTYYELFISSTGETYYDSALTNPACTYSNGCISSCSCTSWSIGICGGGGICSPLEFYQTRTCTPSACDLEERCIEDASCTTCPTTVCDDDIVTFDEYITIGNKWLGD